MITDYRKDNLVYMLLFVTAAIHMLTEHFSMLALSVGFIAFSLVLLRSVVFNQSRFCAVHLIMYPLGAFLLTVLMTSEVFDDKESLQSCLKSIWESDFSEDVYAIFGAAFAIAGISTVIAWIVKNNTVKLIFKLIGTAGVSAAVSAAIAGENHFKITVFLFSIGAAVYILNTLAQNAAGKRRYFLASVVVLILFAAVYSFFFIVKEKEILEGVLNSSGAVSWYVFNVVLTARNTIFFAAMAFAAGLTCSYPSYEEYNPDGVFMFGLSMFLLLVRLHYDFPFPLSWSVLIIYGIIFLILFHKKSPDEKKINVSLIHIMVSVGLIAVSLLLHWADYTLLAACCAGILLLWPCYRKNRHAKAINFFIPVVVLPICGMIFAWNRIGSVRTLTMLTILWLLAILFTILVYRQRKAICAKDNMTVYTVTAVLVLLMMIVGTLQHMPEMELQTVDRGNREVLLITSLESYENASVAWIMTEKGEYDSERQLTINENGVAMPLREGVLEVVVQNSAGNRRTIRKWYMEYAEEPIFVQYFPELQTEKQDK